MDNWRAGFLTEETRPADRADRGEDRSLEVPPRPAGGAEDPNGKEGDAEQRGGDVRGVEEPKGAAGGAEDPEGAVGGAEVVQQQVLSTTPIMLFWENISFGLSPLSHPQPNPNEVFHIYQIYLQGALQEAAGGAIVTCL